MTSIVAFAACAILSGCYNDQSTVKQTKARPFIDTTRLGRAIDQLLVDMDELDSTDEMQEYMDVVSRHMHLLSDGSATQRDIDAAVEEIERSRDRAVKSQYGPESIDVSGITYEEFVNMAPDSLGESYHIEGTITGTTGSFTSEYWELCVRWNDSSNHGESISVRIPQDKYRSSYKKFFSGNCTFIGFNERNSRPTFVCEYAYDGR